jgi:Holliday junction resolvase-like predicted endonuclease
MANDINAHIGAAYEDHVAAWLVSEHGFTVLARNYRHESGVEFDIYCRDLRGCDIGVECKGSNNSATAPGMCRSDNRWKVLGYLYLLRVWRERHGTPVRYMVCTSHLPEPGTEIRRQLDAAEMVDDLDVMLVPWGGCCVEHA